MMHSRRTIIQGMGLGLGLPFLESLASERPEGDKTPLRLLIVSNPLGLHPESFFPTKWGKDFEITRTLKDGDLAWVKDRMTIIQGSDQNQNGGHGGEIAFLTGSLPIKKKHVSIDQLIAQVTTPHVRYPSIRFSLGSTVGNSWAANGIEVKPLTKVDALYDQLFVNLKKEEREKQKLVLRKDRSLLNVAYKQFKGIEASLSYQDRQIFQQYQDSVHALDKSIQNRTKWVDVDKPDLELPVIIDDRTIEHDYNDAFDMVLNAFQTDSTRVATIGFARDQSYLDLDGVNTNYHSLTHNGKNKEQVNGLVKIESFQFKQLSRMLRKMDEINEPFSEGTMLDNTIVVFGSGMRYGGSHSCRDLPLMVIGGGYKHLGNVNVKSKNLKSMPTSNLWVNIQKRFGVNSDKFNNSTGEFVFA